MRKVFLTGFLLFLAVITAAAVETTPFFTKGHPKAMGLELRIDVPSTWRRQEGKRPHILQLFATEYRNTAVNCTLQIHPGDQEFYEEAKKFNNSSLSRKDYEELLPAGAKLIKGSITKIEGETTICLETLMTKERNHLTATIHAWQYMIPYRDKAILLNFSVIGPSGRELDAAFDAMRLTFLEIANSLVILSKYK